MLQFKIWLLRISIITVPLILIIVIMRILLPDISKNYKEEQFGSDREVFESKHFKVLTRKASDSPENISRVCEEFYEAFIAMHGKEIPFRDTDNKIEIWVFGNRKEFDQHYLQNYLTRIPHNAAFYSPLHKKIVLYRNNHIRETLYHELTHMILDVVVDSPSPHWSTWFNEGVATYFEKSKVKNNELVPGHLDLDAVAFVHQAYLQKMYLPLTKLCQASSEDFKDIDNLLFYYESYLLIYFLIHSESAKEKNSFARFFVEEMKPYSCPPTVLLSIFEKDANGIEKEFLEYFSIGNE